MAKTPPITGNEDLDAFLYDVASEINSTVTSSSSGVIYNKANGEITDAEDNVIGYIYRYIHIKYADDNIGTGIANVPLNKNYFGIRNSDLATENNNPADYRWYAVSGGFGSSRSLFYKTTGNRTIRFDADTAGEDYTWVVDSGDAIDLDILVPIRTISFNEIMDNTITELKIADAAVTSAKTNIASIEPATGYLIANSVGATQITDNAISAQKIQANSIVAGKIAANAVTASTIEASAITAVKIAADAVTADKIDVNQLSAISSNIGTITAGSITTDVLKSGTTNINGTDIKFGLGSTDTINNIQSAGYFNSNVFNKFGLGVTAQNSLAVAAATYAYDSSAGGFYSSSNIGYTAYRSVALLGNGAYAGSFQYGQAPPTAKITLAKTGGYAFYIDIGVGGPFTGAHDGLLNNNEIINEGDILVDTGFSVNANISDTITKVSCSSTPNQKGVIGVFNKYSDSSHVPAALSICVSDEVSGSSNFVINPEHEHLLQENKLVIINSIGEGLINVCGENGNIEVGDLIVTSSTPGKGMKQSDDLVRNITVAKSRENITFSSPTEVKQIACIYLAG